MIKKLFGFFLSILMIAGAISIPAEGVYSAHEVPSSAWALASQLNIGWNLGNSLEVQNLDYGWIPENSFGKPGFERIEGLLGNPVTTKSLIQAVADRGFSAIRIPVSFYNHLIESKPRTQNGDGTYTNHPGTTIDPAWLARVKEIVDWALDAGLYVVINDHHDTSMWTNIAWIFAEADDIDVQVGLLTNIWAQYADYFKEYDHRLIFQSTGEIVNRERSFSAKDWDDFRTAHAFNQAFIDTVRATGRNNADRFLILPTYASNSNPLFVDESFHQPYTDTASDKLLYSVHNYSTDIEELEWTFLQLYKRALQYHTPFVMDEAGAMVTESMQTRLEVSYALTNLAEKYGMGVFVWDAGCAEHGYIDRVTTIDTGTIAYVTSWTDNGITYDTDSQAAVDALFRGKTEAVPVTEQEKETILDDRIKAVDFTYLNVGNFERTTPYGAYFTYGTYTQIDANASKPFSLYSPTPKHYACLYPYINAQNAGFQAVLPEGITITIRELDENGAYIGQKYVTKSGAWYVPSANAVYAAVCFRAADENITFSDYVSAVKLGTLELYPAGGNPYVVNEPDAKMPLKKHLTVTGTNDTPDAAFRFRFTQMTDNPAYQREPAEIPEVTLELNAGSVVSTGPNPNQQHLEASVSDVLSPAVYTKAGTYVYLVEEIRDTYVPSYPQNETMEYTDAQFLLYVTVENKLREAGFYIKDAKAVFFRDANGKTKGEEGASEALGKETDLLFSNTYVWDAGGGEHICPSAKFRDLDPASWYHESIDYVLERGLMIGTASDLFSPEGIVTRAMVVTVLYRLENTPQINGAIPFDDVPDGQWYSKAVLWASTNHIVEGYGNGTFGPEDDITREQFAAILYRYCKFKGYNVSATTDLSIYTDSASISDWALDAIKWANAVGLITGRSTTLLAPTDSATRVETATILMRFCKQIVPAT